MKFINNFLNKITMYRLVLYGLFILSFIGIISSFLGFVDYSPLELFIELIVLIFVAHFSNYIFSKIWKTPRNAESAYITALILSFILAPSLVFHDLLWIALTGVVAMFSKYVFAVHRKHIFNPAAIAVVFLGTLGSGIAIWWVATPYMALPVAIFGFLILKKIKKFPLFGAFAITSFILVLFGPLVGISTNISTISTFVLSYPLLFLGCIMLTEPLTLPPTRRLQIIYGAIVGFLFSIQFHIGQVYSTPEVALFFGNIFAYLVSPNWKVKLSFVSKRLLSANVYELLFKPERKLAFLPGQYLEWTLDQERTDSRGNRRYFTIASSPTEEYVHLGVRVDPVHGSTFKKRLLELKEGDPIFAGSLSGEFTLPKDVSKKLVFVAGGVGITPFRSMMKYIYDNHEKRDIILFYACMTTLDFAYKEEIEQIKTHIGMKIVYIATKPESAWSGRIGYITPSVIQEEIPDFLERDYYLSGPNVMVENYEKMLTDIKVSKKSIHTDYFPGY